jgi:hypothetical protein
MTERLNHKLDTSKLKTIKDVRNVFECMGLYSNASEDNEQYELLKEYFTIPNEPQELKFELPRKSLEEISQEFDEKIDKLIEDTKRNFYGSKIYADSKYERAFDKIFDNFEYARENGKFPEIQTLTLGNNLGVNSFTNSFIIKSGGKEVGYYTFGNGYLKYFMSDKPNVVVRFFMNKLLGFRWIDV